jgi:MoxR-like ATPase
MSYQPKFDASALAAQRPPRPDNAVSYLYHPELELAVNVALATERPLLLRGNPGSGKSTLAADVAWKLGRRYDEEVITSRTRAQDLQWQFDTLRRLSDAQAGRRRVGQDNARYVKPGILWRAFQSNWRERWPAAQARAGWDWGGADAGVVLLLDEIDKADPDVPNDLLVALDARWFFVPEIEERVEAPRNLSLLIVLTSNGERELPPAFVRRCVAFDIQDPDGDQLKRIARLHFPAVHDTLLDALLGVLASMADDARTRRLRVPTTAEFLDAVRACDGLGVKDTQDPLWEEIAERALWKHGLRERPDKQQPPP